MALWNEKINNSKGKTTARKEIDVDSIDIEKFSERYEVNIG